MKRILPILLGSILVLTTPVQSISVQSTTYRPVKQSEFHPVDIEPVKRVEASAKLISSLDRVQHLEPKVVRKRKSKAVVIKKPSVVNSGWSSALVSSYGTGDGFLGDKMACGGPLTNTNYTIAYRYLHTKKATLFCGNKIWLKYKNWGPIQVTVTDAGPFVGGRFFDLSPATCRKLHACGVVTLQWKR